MDALDRLIELLADGKWHSITKEFEEAKIRDEAAMPILAFLKDYGFIELKSAGQNIADEQMRLVKSMHEFMQDFQKG